MHLTTPIELVNRQPKPTDYLSFSDIEREYPGTILASTLRVWACTHRYGFDQLVTKIGSKSAVRRDRWESFLESRTGGRKQDPA